MAFIYTDRENDDKGTKRCPGCGKKKGNSRRHNIKPGLCDSCLELKKRKGKK